MAFSDMTLACTRLWTSNCMMAKRKKGMSFMIQRSPAQETNNFSVVGVGALGSRAALEQFFAQIPEESGMAFVVLYENKATLSSLQALTTLPVTEVTQATTLEPNHIYLIPAHKQLAVVEDELRLLESSGKYKGLDDFFRGLAEGFENRLVAVLLSTLGADGLLGLRHVKEHWGITLAQDAALPRNVIDIVLAAAEMPKKLLSLRQMSGRLSPLRQEIALLETAPVSEATEKVALPPSEVASEALKDILTLLKENTGHDFQNYKQPTLLRRIARRLQVHELSDMAGYLGFLRRRPEEVQGLLNDLLISVTDFFRDEEAFETLGRNVLPRLFANKTSADTVRIWCCGCATGEEAYSLAMLFSEYTSKRSNVPKFQIFASDISEQVIRTAREGHYDLKSLAGVSPERLERFFVKDAGGYRVKKELRDTVLFTLHNVLRDPPFSRLELISCRNLLIYLNRETQEKVLKLFQFALRPGSYLFLGSSESTESAPGLFTTLDKQHRLYQSRATSVSHGALSVMPLSGRWEVKTPDLPLRPREQRVSYGELHYKLLEAFAPPSVLVNEEDSIVHLSEHAGQFLHLSGGEPSRQLFQVVHPGLKLELQRALFEAKKGSGVGVSRHIPFKLAGKDIFVTITVRLVTLLESSSGFYLVTFKEEPLETSGQAVSKEPTRDTLVEWLEEELQTSREQLRMTIEQYESSAEELRASNEEFQALNEELRAASEELETSKEELQSVNEELLTMIDDLKRTEEALRASREELEKQTRLYDTTLSTIHDYVYNFDREGRFLYANQVLLDLWGLSKEQAFGKTMADLNYPKEVERTLLEAVREVFATGKTVTNETFYTAPNGRSGYFENILSPFFASDGSTEFVSGSSRDITERKSAEAALRESEARFHNMADYAPVMVWVTDADGTCTYLSQSWYDFTGQTPETGLGFGWLNATHPDDRAESARIFLEANNKRESFRLEYRLRHKDGSYHWAIDSARPRFSDDGTFLGYIGSVLDIDERKQTEEALRAQHELTTTIANNATQAIFMMNAAGYCTFMNPAAETMLGFSFEEIRRRPLHDMIHHHHPDGRPYPMHECPIDRALPENFDIREHEDTFIRKNGEFFPVLVAASPIFRDGKPVSTVIEVRDITERKRWEETLRASEQALREADRRKDDFLAVLGHELRNPLAPIRMGVEIMKRSNDLATIQEARDIIERQTEQLTHLLDDLLDVSRISRGAISLHKERVDLAETVRLALESSQTLFEERNHQLTLLLPPTPIYLEADKTRLTQIILNLLTNAAKYTNPGGSITLRAELKEHEVMVAVQDNGIGIPPQLQPKVFDMFTRLERKESYQQQGLGIGLSLVKQLSELHGGKVEVFSEGEGRGSTFMLHLPVAVSAPADGKTGSQPSSQAPLSRRILVVDDYAANLKMIARMLRLMGHQVVTAERAEEALLRLEEFSPEVILLDLNLPGMNGYELAQCIRSNPAHNSKKLFALTGYGQPSDVEKTKQAGFDDHLVKPVELEKLEALLARV
jgi:two-component system, chemotaxis family, CheB/CheR fusion protein